MICTYENCTFLPRFVFFTSNSFAQSAAGSWICESIFRSSNYGCNYPARGNSLGGSYPQIFDAFNINPASIPTSLTPVGIEVFTSNGDFNFALIKGQGKFGAALSSSETSSNFFSNINNYEAATTASLSKSSTNNGAYVPNLNFGIAVPLISTNGPSKVVPILGISVKRNKDTGTYKQTAGLSLNTSIVHAGASIEKDTNGEQVFNASIGARIWRLMFDFTYFENMKTTYSTSDRTTIFSSSLLWGNLEMDYAYRYQKNSMPTYGTSITYSKFHNLFGAQYKISDKFSCGVFHNYILDVDWSFVARLFF